MDKSRWDYIKNLQPSEGRYIHISTINPSDQPESERKKGWRLASYPSAKNLYKNARRKFFKQLGRRQALKTIKRTVRENTL